MTSLDDTIISRQNLLLLDNVTNYSRPAIDYFTQGFQDQDIAMTWKLLRKMRNHKLLRLPSCSFENDFDYRLYLSRLHHTLWRRWSQQLYGIGGRADPLSVNWDKDLDITVLYGPDLTGSEGGKCVQEEKEKEQEEEEEEEEHVDVDVDVDVDANSAGVYSEDDDASVYSSSVSSSTSSIFDQVPKSLRFSDTVLRRDIDSMGLCHESHIMMKRPRTSHYCEGYDARDWI
ncbi:ZYRO0B16060p [Zygosaccharomyces rouxii]|uniref:ZYRO0B16060p n=1 Tax=Zygosaccharomyces rouxii (strain ATCC 2623 / CBS 732 / NBRC 1130 / NCYC 568 / NRRL Y-229) TaxID=559307 RepID=C5DSD8_ZYGRC|nr:uncharacterized protein ZYRO0B16060g [Zygosaccharomyces rouxii]KAH9199770.1 hypothetical protein LQ764DRAFT_104825 [Zygosaccharomyces rouxii]CAR26699.1 ZYRO0B16060p [Zygosaccharomyces rouxii]